jgi:hypothetical protein
LYVGLLALAAPASFGADFAGIYTLTEGATTLTLTLQPGAQGEFTGSLTGSTGEQYAVEAVEEDGVIMGACYDEQSLVYLEASLQGNTLLVTMIDPDYEGEPDYNTARELTFTKSGVGGVSKPVEPESVPASVSVQRTNPAVPTPSDVAGTVDDLPPPAPRQSGKTYKHPIGFSFWYPPTWSITTEDDVLRLMPPNPVSTSDGPSEFYFISAESVANEGISDAADPRVASYIDMQVNAVLPGLSRTDPPRPVTLAKGTGVRLDWKAQSLKGEPILARAYVSILRDHGVALSAIAVGDLLQKRNADLLQMFQSFGFGEGEKDPRLVGQWSLFALRSIRNESIYETDWSRAQLTSETNTKLTFYPDGSWTRKEDHHMLAGAGGVWLESKESSTTQGKWNAANGLLYMVWDDESWQEYYYTLQQTNSGIELRLVSGNRGEIWRRAE